MGKDMMSNRKFAAMWLAGHLAVPFLIIATIKLLEMFF